MYPLNVRTTITLDDDVHEFAVVYARARGITLSAAISELIRKAEASPPPEPDIRWSESGLPMFPPTGKTITTEMVKRLEEEPFDPKAFT